MKKHKKKKKILNNDCKIEKVEKAGWVAGICAGVRDVCWKFWEGDILVPSKYIALALL